MNDPDPERLVRISVFLTVRTLDRLRAKSARERLPVAHLIRATLDRSLGQQRPLPRGGFL